VFQRDTTAYPACICCLRNGFEIPQEHCPIGQGVVKHYEWRELKVVIRMGNIVFANTNAIVKASNTLLKLGAGVSGAIATATRPGLQEEMCAMAQKRNLAEGDAVITGSFGLPCLYIIHAATARGSANAVQTALRNVFRICNEENLSSVAIPALGTGTGALPIATFAERAVKYFEEHGPSTLKK
jgi:O-acetyl-ADP-ribose deacetylase (regulator of RNase III)